MQTNSMVWLYHQAVSFVYITVGMNKSALSIGFVVLPVAFVHRALGPNSNKIIPFYLEIKLTFD